MLRLDTNQMERLRSLLRRDAAFLGKLRELRHAPFWLPTSEPAAAESETPLSDHFEAGRQKPNLWLILVLVVTAVVSLGLDLIAILPSCLRDHDPSLRKWLLSREAWYPWIYFLLGFLVAAGMLIRKPKVAAHMPDPLFARILREQLQLQHLPASPSARLMAALMRDVRFSPIFKRVSARIIPTGDVELVYETARLVREKESFLQLFEIAPICPNDNGDEGLCPAVKHEILRAVRENLFRELVRDPDFLFLYQELAARGLHLHQILAKIDFARAAKFFNDHAKHATTKTGTDLQGIANVTLLILVISMLRDASIGKTSGNTFSSQQFTQLLTMIRTEVTTIHEDLAAIGEHLSGKGQPQPLLPPLYISVPTTQSLGPITPVQHTSAPSQSGGAGTTSPPNDPSPSSADSLHGSSASISFPSTIDLHFSGIGSGKEGSTPPPFAEDTFLVFEQNNAKSEWTSSHPITILHSHPPRRGSQ